MDHSSSSMRGRRLLRLSFALVPLMSVVPLFSQSAFAATLDIVGGALTYTGSSGANNLTVSVSGGTYTFNDAGETISLTGTTTGWSGNETNTIKGPDSSVSSITISLADGVDIFNLRSTNDTVTVTGGLGNDTINVSSNAPSNTGTLYAIAADVTVVDDSGNDRLLVSDYSAFTGNSAVNISSSAITGIAGPTDGSTISYSGPFTLVRVIGGNTPGLAETYTVNSTSAAAAKTQLDTNAGADAIAVRATTNPTVVNSGAGNDSITVSSNADVTLSNLDSISSTLSIDAGAGANTLVISDHASTADNSAVSVTNTAITGISPATINYKAVGGTFSNFELQGSNTATDAFTFGPLSTNTTANVYGNGGDDTFVIAGNVKGSLFGGASDDTFTVNAGVTLNGDIHGGTGTNTYQYGPPEYGTVTGTVD